MASQDVKGVGSLFWVVRLMLSVKVSNTFSERLKARSFTVLQRYTQSLGFKTQFLNVYFKNLISQDVRDVDDPSLLSVDL